MSAYFQRLIQQSGLRVQEPLAAPAPITGIGASPPASDLTSASDLVEIHEERTAEAPPGAPTPANASARTPAPGFPVAAQPVKFSEDHSAPLPSAPAEIVIGQRIEIDATPNTEPSNTPQNPIHPPIPSSGPAPRTDAPAERLATPEGVSAEMLQAVMRWIAAGPTPLAVAQREKSAPAELSEQPNLAVQLSPASSVENQPPVASAIPERVIEIVEEHFEPAPAPVLPARATVPLPRPAALPASPNPPPAEPVHVSIGSISVRIEAPPSAPAPVRPARAESVLPNRSSRTSHFSKLRRYYILPH